MKRLLTFVLAIAMLLSLCSCVTTPNEVPDDTPDTTVNQDENTENQDDASLDADDGNLIPEYDTNMYAYAEEAPSICEEFSDWFRVGAAINPWMFENKDSKEYKDITKQFNTFVLENDTKPDHIQPREGVFSFDATDKFVEFGEETGAVLRGHTLVWHSQCPDWFFFDNGKEASAELVLERMKNHITTTVTRYKGKIDTWDVVNETLGDGGGLRDSYWYQRVGDYDGDGDKYDFIEQAFIAARAADPDAKLIFNDYGIEYNESKAIAAYMAVKTMLEEGVPIDGIGLQMHLDMHTDPEALRKNIEIIAKLKDINPDFTIEITELDVSIYAWNEGGEKEYSEEIQNTQKKAYVGLFNLFMDLAEEGLLDSVVFWGIGDAHSWLNTNEHQAYPFLFDHDLKLKDNYWAVIEAARQRKNTK